MIVGEKTSDTVLGTISAYIEVSKKQNLKERLSLKFDGCKLQFPYELSFLSVFWITSKFKSET